MATTSTTAHLPDGNHLFYLDSGPVPGSETFTTVVLVHGSGFNAYCFEHVFSLAPKYNMRLVAIQRKGYKGSSSSTGEELADNPRDSLKEMGAMMMYFMAYLVTETKVCKPVNGRTKGGISVVGWSVGSLGPTAMFSRQMMKQETYELIKPYITSLIFYDPPHQAMGVPATVPFPDIHFPLTEEGLNSVRVWVTSYYDHPEEWDGDISMLDCRNRAERASVDNWSKAQCEQRFEVLGMFSDTSIVQPNAQEAIRNLIDDVVFGTDRQQRAFPDAHMGYITTGRAVWPGTWACFVIRRRYQEFLNRGEGENLRLLSFRTFEEGNHMVHYDHPEDFMKMLAELTHARGKFE